MKIVIIGESSYSMSEAMAESVLKTAKNAMKGKNAIYAIEKNDIIEMKKDESDSAFALSKEVKKYIVQGFKVSYITDGYNGKK